MSFHGKIEHLHKMSVHDSKNRQQTIPKVYSDDQNSVMNTFAYSHYSYQKYLASYEKLSVAIVDSFSDMNQEGDRGYLSISAVQNGVVQNSNIVAVEFIYKEQKEFSNPYQVRFNAESLKLDYICEATTSEQLEGQIETISDCIFQRDKQFFLLEFYPTECFYKSNNDVRSEYKTFFNSEKNPVPLSFMAEHGFAIDIDATLKHLKSLTVEQAIEFLEIGKNSALSIATEKKDDKNVSKYFALVENYQRWLQDNGKSLLPKKALLDLFTVEYWMGSYSYNCSILQIALKKGCSQVLDRLFDGMISFYQKRWLDKEAIEEIIGKCQGAVFYAMEFNHLDAIRVLLNKIAIFRDKGGVYPEIAFDLFEDKNNGSALSNAIKKGYCDLVKFVFEWFIDNYSGDFKQKLFKLLEADSLNGRGVLRFINGDKSKDTKMMLTIMHDIYFLAFDKRRITQEDLINLINVESIFKKNNKVINKTLKRARNILPTYDEVTLPTYSEAIKLYDVI